MLGTPAILAKRLEAPQNVAKNTRSVHLQDHFNKETL